MRSKTKCERINMVYVVKYITQGHAVTNNLARSMDEYRLKPVVSKNIETVGIVITSNKSTFTYMFVSILDDQFRAELAEKNF